MAEQQEEALSSKKDQYTSLLTGKFQELVAAVPEDYFTLSEQDLSDQFTVTDKDWLIRDRLHKVMNKAMAEGKTQIVIADVYRNIISRQAFYTNMESSAYRLAWWLTPLPTADEKMKVGYYQTAELLEKILKEIKASVNSKNIDRIIKALPHIMKAQDFFANRYIGPVTHQLNINQKTQSVGILKTVTDSSGEIDPEKLIEQYNQLKGQVAGKVKDVTPYVEED